MDSVDTLFFLFFFFFWQAPDFFCRGRVSPPGDGEGNCDTPWDMPTLQPKMGVFTNANTRLAFPPMAAR